MRKTGVVLAVWVLSTVLAAAQGMAGQWAGEWSGAAGGSGQLRLKLEQSGGAWKAEASFTLGDAEVKTEMKSVKVDGDALELEYEFDLQGNKLKSKLTGKRDGASLSGKYETTTVPDGSPVDNGEWKAKQ
jgi:hypothetical protein